MATNRKGVGPTYLHKRGHSNLFPEAGGGPGTADEAKFLGGGLRGIGPALAGNVGASLAFALSREGDQDVDVPMLAPARSRCRFVDWGQKRGRSLTFTQKGPLSLIPKGGWWVRDCWRGEVPRGGSAGSVLRSQGTLGPPELSRWRARGIRMSTFQCSLRPGPAAASWKRRKPRGR